MNEYKIELKFIYREPNVSSLTPRYLPVQFGKIALIIESDSAKNAYIIAKEKIEDDIEERGGKLEEVKLLDIARL